MDCPHFMQLCFLILTIAAPHPNISMPSNNYAEGTQDQPHVTVYHCKDCERNVCKLSNYEDFVKIGETQNETFSNEIIQLVTNETHIIVCFQQESTFPEGIYAIFWEKATGAGDSCGGILEAIASSENVMFNTTKICCGAETEPSLTEHPLKCYTGETNTKSLAAITGDAPFAVYDKPSTSIVIPVLILGVCALATYCVLRNRKRQGPVIVLPQTFKEQDMDL